VDKVGLKYVQTWYLCLHSKLICNTYL